MCQSCSCRVHSSGFLGTQEALQRVAFQNVGASIDACRAIGELLTNSAHLRQLHLANNMSDDDVSTVSIEFVARQHL